MKNCDLGRLTSLVNFDVLQIPRQSDRLPLKVSFRESVAFHIQLQPFCNKIKNFVWTFIKCWKVEGIFNPWMSHISQPWYLTDGPSALFSWNWGWLRANHVHGVSWGPWSILLVDWTKTGLKKYQLVISSPRLVLITTIRLSCYRQLKSNTRMPIHGMQIAAARQVSIRKTQQNRPGQPFNQTFVHLGPKLNGKTGLPPPPPKITSQPRTHNWLQ